MERVRWRARSRRVEWERARWKMEGIPSHPLQMGREVRSRTVLVTYVPSLEIPIAGLSTDALVPSSG